MKICEPGATELELLLPLKQAIITYWKFQDFSQDIFTGAEKHQGFVDCFKY